VDGSSVVDNDDLLVITSDSDTESCSHNRTTQDEIPDVWDGFDEGCYAAAFDAVTSPPQVDICMCTVQLQWLLGILINALVSSALHWGRLLLQFVTVC